MPTTPMTNSTIHAVTAALQVGQRITMQWQLLPDTTLLESDGVCACRRGRETQILYDDIGLQSLPSEREAVQVYTITLHPYTNLHLLPINIFNRDVLPMDASAHIYADGGAQPSSGGPSASGIRIFERGGGGTIVTDHGRFFVLAKSNAAELIAVIGAMRYAIRFHADSQVIIIVDSMNVYKWLTGEAQCKLKELQPLYTIACDLFKRHLNKITLAHMLRVHINPADDVCNVVIGEARHKGAYDLFPEAPLIINRRRIPRPVEPTIDPAPVSPLKFESLDDFIKLRTFKSRATVPPQSAAYWAALVRRQTKAILLASTPAERDDAIIQLFALPSRYLPTASSGTRINQHLASMTPFQINLTRKSMPQRDHHKVNHRLVEAVQRLALDRKIRTANKLLATGSNDMPHDEKVAALRAKLIPAGPTPSPSFPRSDIPTIAGDEIRDALRKTSRQSATSIDGWTKDLLQTAIAHQPGLDDEIGAIITILLSQQLSPLLEDILRAARLVAIPKTAGGIRPIAIANIWLKLAGTIALLRDKTRPCRRQYAVGRKNGCETIIHQVMDALYDNRELGLDEDDDHNVVVKFDISNAFNCTLRSHVKDVLESHPVTTQQFFRLAYGGPSPLAVFGKSTYTMLSMEEGIRQGDSTSSYFFCLAVDSALAAIVEEGYDAFMYCDDLTVVIKSQFVPQCIEDITAEFAKIGLQVNDSKTKVFDPTRKSSEPFVILGADLNGSEEFLAQNINKQRTYFETMKSLAIHPQLKVCLLRLCGGPRIRYLCSVMPPATLGALVIPFDDAVRKALIHTLQLPPGTIPDAACHDVLGAGIPQYRTLAPVLYAAFQDFAVRGIFKEVELVSRGSFPTARHNLDASWLWYDGSMTPAEFIAAFTLRLGAIPDHLRLFPAKCDCGATITTATFQIEHTLKCDRFTRVTHTVRHNMVRDAIVRTANTYGISTTKEPTVYPYVEGRMRPDIIFHVSRPVVTDVTVVFPDDDPGSAVDRAEAAKVVKHSSAAASLGHLFIPAGFEAFGTFGKGVSKLITELAKELPPQQQFGFKHDMNRTISTALARGRAASLFGSRWRRNDAS